MNEEQERQLLEEGVKFLPWVGSDYEQGFGYAEDGSFHYGGKKVLVLGESHYDVRARTEQDLVAGTEYHERTRETIGEILDGSGGRWKSTSHKFEHAVVGKRLNGDERQEFYRHIAFYNYVQALVYGPREKPKWKDFEASLQPFFAVLDALRPDCVIAWGMRLCRGMSGTTRSPVEGFAEEKSCAYIYKVGQRAYPCLFILHPAYPGFSIAPAHNAILKFMGP